MKTLPAFLPFDMFSREGGGRGERGRREDRGREEGEETFGFLTPNRADNALTERQDTVGFHSLAQRVLVANKLQVVPSGLRATLS